MMSSADPSVFKRRARGVYALERRRDGVWEQIGLFGDEGEAESALDQSVGSGEARLDDLRVREIRSRWVAFGVTAAVLFVIGGVALFVIALR